MADDPPGSWPIAEENRNGPDENRDSVYTAVSEENAEEPSTVVEEEVHNSEAKGKGMEHAGKVGMFRMPELPPEIRETYAQHSFSCPQCLFMLFRGSING